MLKKDAITKLKALGFDLKKLEEAIKADDEQDFAVPEIVTYTEEQLAERDKNTITAAKPEIIKAAKDAGIEIANKAIAKKFNLADIDTKDPDKVIAALEAGFSKGDQGLKDQIALLQKDKETLTSQVESEKTNARNAAFDADLISHFPTNRNGLSDKEYLALIKLNIAFEESDGKMVAKKDGQIITDDKTRAPLGLKDVITNVFAEKKWIAEAGNGGGRGGNDNSGNGATGIKTQSKALEQYVKENPGKAMVSPEAFAFVNKIAAETTDFVWD